MLRMRTRRTPWRIQIPSATLVRARGLGLDAENLVGGRVNPGQPLRTPLFVRAVLCQNPLTFRGVRHQPILALGSIRRPAHLTVDTTGPGLDIFRGSGIGEIVNDTT